MSMFVDRRDAGRQLASTLEHAGLHDPIVLALPRGGVPVAFEIADRLQAPLDVFVVRKLGAPGQPELGVGAVAEDGTTLVDEATCRALAISPRSLDAVADAERAELERRVARYRRGRELPSLADREVVLVDDGLATGVTARAALHAIASQRPARLVLAVPVAAPDTAARLESTGTEVVCLARPAGFQSVGSWYRRFDQTTDDEVVDLLARRRARPAAGPADVDE